ncbi:MAG: hypothetical protein ACI4PW_05175 [Alphaproteobacteria bacterium]
MTDASKKETDLLRTLKDAGCDTRMIRTFFQLEKEGGTIRQLRLLSGHRKLLVRTLHEDQKKIDCLDFLMFSLKSKTP